jgi:hypothetical protein
MLLIKPGTPAKATMLVVLMVCGGGSLMDCGFDMNHIILLTIAMINEFYLASRSQMPTLREQR